MSFYQPFFLWLFFLLPVYWLFFHLSNKNRQKQLEKILRRDLVGRFLKKNNLRSVTLTSLTLALLILSLARPQWGLKDVVVEQRGIQLVFVIDLSNSMLAEDIKPSRIKKVQIKISDFISGLHGDEVSIVAFAGSAFIACPLTSDYDVLSEYVESLNPSVISSQGTDIGNALQVAMEAFDDRQNTQKAIILISDGEDHGSTATEQANIAKKKGIVVYTIGIGDPSGSPIATVGENGEFSGYLKDASGKVILSKPNFTALESISNITGGKSSTSSGGDLSLDELYRSIRSIDKNTLSSRNISTMEERYFYFTLGAFFFFLLDLLGPYLPKRENP